jgi:DNA-binding NtrC family response regulator
MAQPSFFGQEIRREGISQTDDILEKLNGVVDWDRLRPLLQENCNTQFVSNAGHEFFDLILMFKIVVIKQLYNLSHLQTSHQIRDCESFIRFLDLEFQSQVPDQDTIRHYEELLSENDKIKSLFAQTRETIGAIDYLPKPFMPQQIYMLLEKVAKQSALVRENAALRRQLEVDQGLQGIIGESPAMQKVFHLLKRISPTEGTILITGESGTGKEMVVQAIHRLSRRQEKPLVACDCRSLAPTLLETELFGHVKGSFSGEISTKQGLFESADSGTLFLDEISNLSKEIQGKLLRVLETKKIRKVGDTAEREVDIRLVVATNRDLSEMVASGDFREDLYYRLNVVPVFLPPLRKRDGDIPRLAMAFLDRFCHKNRVEVELFTPEAMALMEGYRWPGNVRELRNIVERIAILCDNDRIEPRHLPPEIQSVSPAVAPSNLPDNWEDFKRLKQEVRDATVQNLEQRFLKEALVRSEGSVSGAARDIGMQRTHFHTLMRKYGISAKE